MSNGSSSAPLLRLEIVEGPQAGTALDLDGPVIIGRSSARSTFVLRDSEASRRHASLIPQGESANIQDLGSTNGTFVNDERLDDRRVVEVGDRVRIGTTVLELGRAEAVEAEAPPEPMEMEVEPVEPEAVEAELPPEPVEMEVEPVEDAPAVKPAAEAEAPPEPVEADEEEARRLVQEAEAARAAEEAEAARVAEEAEAARVAEEAEAARAAEEAEAARVAEEAEAARSAEEAEATRVAEEAEAARAAEEAEAARAAEEAEVKRAASAAFEAQNLAKLLHARLGESFSDVMHAWSNRDPEKMQSYVSRAHLARAREAADQLDRDFQVNYIRDLQLRDTAVPRPTGPDPHATPVEVYVSFVARDWIEDLRTGEVIEGEAEEPQAFTERWTFIREGRRGWVIDRVESVWSGPAQGTNPEDWLGLPPGAYSRRNRPTTWRQWDGVVWDAVPAATG